MSTTTREATCGCGQLRVEAKGDPDIVVACNCLACQRRTGSPFGVGAYYKKEMISAAGAEKAFARVAQSGLDVGTRFCPDCGTSVYWTADLRPDHYGVAVGCFGDPGFIPPARVVWNENQHSWVEFPKDLQSFRQGTPAPQLTKET